MYALVRFRDDNVKVVVNVNKIKRFSARDIFDFDTTVWYRVHWRDEKQEGYFKAQVLGLFETKEEAEQPKKRIPCLKPPSSDSSDASEASDASVSSAASRVEKHTGCLKTISFAAHNTSIRSLHRRCKFLAKGRSLLHLLHPHLIHHHLRQSGHSPRQRLNAL